MKKKAKVNLLAILFAAGILAWHNAQLAEQACLDMGNPPGECEKVWW